MYGNMSFSWVIVLSGMSAFFGCCLLCVVCEFYLWLSQGNDFAFKRVLGCGEKVAAILGSPLSAS